MVTSFDYVALMILGYLAGSLPTGVLLGHLRGIDVRAIGSGNIGATNVARALGPRSAVWTFTGDAAKGFLPVLLARAWAPDSWIVPSAVAFLCVAGHCFSIFLDFNGGKGVATSAGVFLALAPHATIGAAIIWGAVFAVTKVSSFGSFAALPVMIGLLAIGNVSAFGLQMKSGRAWLPLAAAVTILVLVRHKANIRRMISGAENRFDRNGTRAES